MVPAPRDKVVSEAPSRLVEAARELLTERRPSEITVRAVAERAGVQHSLITRHFGSRDALLTVTVAQVFADIAAAIDDAPDLDRAITVAIDTFGSNPALASAVSVLVSQGVTPTTGRYPIIDAVEAKLRGAGVASGQAADTALMLVVTITGWVAAEPWWLTIADQDDAREARRILERALRALVADALGSTP